MSNSNSSSSGIGFTGLLAIVFITLKLCKVLTWSWWWVLSPIWITVGIVLLMLIGYVILCWRIDVREKKRLASGRSKIGYEMSSSKWKQRVEELQKNKKLN